MAVSSSLTRADWARWTSLVLATLLVLCAGSTLAGWALQIPVLVQLKPDFPALKANAALGLFILGVVLLLYEHGQRRTCWLALLPAAVGALALLQDLALLSFGVDELLVRDFIRTSGSAPGRMAPAVAISLLAVGLAVASLGVPRWPRRRTLGLAVVGSLALAVGAATLLGYALELRAVYRWGIGTSTAPLSAIVLTLLGLTILNLAWRENQFTRGSAPGWLPLPVVVGSATLTLILWTGLSQREKDYLDSTTQNWVNTFAGAINLEIEAQANLIDRIARRWTQPNTNPVVWEVDATTHLGESPAGLAVALVSPAGKTRWWHTAHPPAHEAALDHAAVEVRQLAMEAARRTGAPAVSGTLEQPGTGRGFAIYAPIYRDGALWAYAVGEYAYEPLIGNLFNQRLKLQADYDCVVQVAGERVYGSVPASLAGTPIHRGIDKIFTMFDRRVRISLAPSDSFFRQNRRFLPELALAAGFGITVLLGLSVHLARAAHTSLRAAERSNLRLQAENEERRRVEAMLKVSDERLRLALDSTRIGIFEWNVASNHIYYSPGLWSMLDYQNGQVGSRPEAWSALIHPDDLPSFRSAVDQQLNAEATFIDPEYRVRTGTGEWRWLYARAKTVTRSAAGTPLRIIGTLQDITDRKQAEAALRESQAATRKLSLVASRTDNLVIIGTPDGRVDWVNESFTRVLEYPLDEIRGRRPATFLVGPETSAHTARRITTAVRRGHGLSCDVVTYSKSGRKYHVHLEVQPIRNEAGAVETYIAILADITARVDTEYALRRAKRDADHASRAKSEFLASMSHEIRTPMNGVIGMTSLLLDTALDPEQRDFVSTIRTSGEALLTIINDILDFSKIESGKMELERLPFDLSVCVEEALDLFAMQAAGKRLELAYHVHDDVPAWVQGDITRLRQVLVNLVNNAVKFTPSGSITITVRRQPGAPPDLPAPRLMLEFVVADTGIGIPPDRINRLFKPFSQVDSSTTRKYGGTGLGLAICHRLAHLMGGGIRVASTVGEGSRFVFSLQTEAARPPVPPPVLVLPEPLRTGYVLGLEDNDVAQQRLASHFRRWGASYRGATSAAAALDALDGPERPALVLLDHDLLLGPEASRLIARLDQHPIPLLFLLAPGQSSSATPFQRPHVVPLNKPIKTATLLRCLQHVLGAEEPPPAAGRAAAGGGTLAEDIPLQVLLVEDNPVNQKVALRFLDRLGYRAAAVNNGLEAVAAITAGGFDLVLMDLQMPEMDGFEAARRVRAQLPPVRQPKIVALTANALQGDRELCLAAGMDDYITKPVKLADLRDVILRQFPTSVEPA